MNEILEILTPKEIGARLSLVRQGLNLTQSEVAKEIQTTQIKISKIEQGNSVTTPTFLRLLAFYSQSISLDVLFAEKMTFVTHENLFNKDYALSKIVKEKLELLRISITHNLTQANDEINKAMSDTMALL